MKTLGCKTLDVSNRSVQYKASYHYVPFYNQENGQYIFGDDAHQYKCVTNSDENTGEPKEIEKERPFNRERQNQMLFVAQDGCPELSVVVVSNLRVNEY